MTIGAGTLPIDTIARFGIPMLGIWIGLADNCCMLGLVGKDSVEMGV